MRPASEKASPALYPPPPPCTCAQVFQNFVPHIVGMGADMAAMMEKCAVVDERASYSGRPIKGMPNVSEKDVQINLNRALRCSTGVPALPVLL